MEHIPVLYLHSPGKIGAIFLHRYSGFIRSFAAVESYKKIHLEIAEYETDEKTILISGSNGYIIKVWDQRTHNVIRSYGES